MNYDMQKIAKMASRAEFDIDLSKMSKVTKNRLIKSFELGYLTSITGDAAQYHSVLTDHLKITAMQFSKKGEYWDYLYLKNMNAKGIPSLSDWWKADRVAYRMEHPDEWARMEREGGWYKKEITVEPRWESRMSVRIMAGKEFFKFDTIAEAFTNTDEYQQKKIEAIQMINEGHTITYTYVL